MATINPTSASSATISQLLIKLGDADPDFRFMALNDLLAVLTLGRPDILHNDYNTAARTADHLVRALDDQNGEVQNLAIKCLGALVYRLPAPNIAPLMEKLSGLKLKNSVDTAVQSLALITVISALPRPTATELPTKDVVEAYSSVSRMLIPRLLGRPAAAAAKTASKTSRHGTRVEEDSSVSSIEMTADAVDVLIQVVRSFGVMLQAVEVEALLETVVAILHDPRASSVAKKRAVVAVVILAVYLPDEALHKLIGQAAVVLKSDSAGPAMQRLYISILGSMARSMALRFGGYIETVAPLILQALDQSHLDAQLEAINEGNDGTDFGDVREAALVALEALLSSCPSQMRPHTAETTQACLRYLKYDPNYVADEDEDEAMESDDDDGFSGSDDDDFDVDGGFDDDDDASWKVRRCAAKALHTLISTRSSGDLLENGVLYRDVAPQLIRRMQEREENVRLEVLAALSLLVRKTGEGVVSEFSLESSGGEVAQLPQSRKRRRQSSSTGVFPGRRLASPPVERAAIPVTGPRADLAAQTAALVGACAKLLNGKQIPTKQAVINLLNDLVAVQRGGLSEYFELVLGTIIEAVQPAGAAGTSGTLATGTWGAAPATPATLRMAALHLVGHIANTHSTQALQPYISRMVTSLLAVAHDRFYKISAEAIGAAEEVVKAITPPRARPAAVATKFRGELQQLYTMLLDRTMAADVDAEVRQRAIQALGTLLARTVAPEAAEQLTAAQRTAALTALFERLCNETSRLAAVRAVDVVVTAVWHTSRPAELNLPRPLQAEWVYQVAVELGAQLRKANRALRGASIQALWHLVRVADMYEELDDKTIEAVAVALEPVITDSDPHLLAPALRIMRVLVEDKPDEVATSALVEALCRLLRTSVAATVLDPLVALVITMGETQAGHALMKGLLTDVGVAGDPAVVGKVMGNLLVAGGGTMEVTIESFVQETQTSRADPARASLALTVLGEAALRKGPTAPLAPALFLGQFEAQSEAVSMAAAMALGRAAAGNVPVYVPEILSGLAAGGGRQYLLLQSVKELLLQAPIEMRQLGPVECVNVRPYTDAVWTQLLAAAAAGPENNRAVCAECVGRLAIIEPATFVPRLQGLLADAAVGMRALAVQALRYTLPETGEEFDAVLREHLAGMLSTALADGDMEIRRLAMTALNAAAHNKPELVLGHLGALLPFIMDESRKKPALVREVQMGPFKHLVDDGLEVRKGAYETLYALMETAFSRISLLALFERIVAGLADDHDIRALCNLMLSRLAYIAPAETARQLPAIADKYRAILSTKLKDNAVKQEHEKQEDANKSVLRATLLLAERLRPLLGDSAAAAAGAGASGGGGAAGAGAAAAAGGGDTANAKWAQYWDWVNKTFDAQLRVLRDENRELGTSGF